MRYPNVIAAMNLAGPSAILYYLAGYLFSVLGAFIVICIVIRQVDSEEISAVAGLSQRSPILALCLAMAMVSLAGIPPLAGFFGKFLLLRALLERGALQPGFYWLAGVTIVGVVISFYYYLGIVRAIYWSKPLGSFSSPPLALPTRWALALCMAGMLFLGVYPNPMVRLSIRAASTLQPGGEQLRQASTDPFVPTF